MERTVTFTMEDALISPISFSILSGAGLIDASEDTPVFQHMTETTDDRVLQKTGAALEAGDPSSDADEVIIYLNNKPVDSADNGKMNQINANEDWIYVMAVDSFGDPTGEPYIAKRVGDAIDSETNKWKISISKDELATGELNGRDPERDYFVRSDDESWNTLINSSVFVVDYYVAQTSNAQQIEITADKFGGNYYLEASTLFRNTAGVDMPAEFIIPNCKIQSNFTFTMASSGDPSTFTFTMDAFPDYTRFDKTKQVLAAIQIMSDADSGTELRRPSTITYDTVDSNDIVVAGTKPEEGGGVGG